MDIYKRIVIAEHGNPDVLKMVEEVLPEPMPGQVRIRVLAAGVGYADVMAQRGGYPLAPRMPFTPGYDFVGIVDQLGEKVSGIAIGQYVAALNPDMGSYAEYVCVDPEILVPVPKNLDPAEVTCLILNYLTAHCILHRKAKIRKGESVLIHAAAGGVGTALLQLGKLFNLKMYGTVSSSKQEIVRKLGGIPIDYRNEDFLQRIIGETKGGVDAAFDPIGGSNLRRSYSAVRKGGRIICYGFAGDNFGGLMTMITGVLQMFGLNILPNEKRVRICATPGEVKKDITWYKETLGELIMMLSMGTIHPVVGARVPLSEVRKAHQLVENGSVSGKVVLICGHV